MRRPAARPLTLTLTLTTWALAGCQQAAHPAATGHLPELPQPPEDQVVARVNGAPITVQQVATQAQAAGQTPRAALDALVRAEILAQEADRRGLFDDREVQRAGQAEMVRDYLAATFEKDVTPQSAVPELDIKKAYQRAQSRLVHGPMKNVEHVLVFREDRNVCSQADIEAIAQQVHQAALGVHTHEDFEKLAMDPAIRGPANKKQCELKHEQIPVPRTGMVVEEFAKAAFDLKQPGDISPVVVTQYGAHVIRLIRDIPAENVSLEEATPHIRQSLWPAARVRAFTSFQDQVQSGHKVAVFDDHLSALPDESK